MGCPTNSNPDSDGTIEGSTEGSMDGTPAADAGSSDGTSDGVTDGSIRTDAGSSDGSTDGTATADAGGDTIVDCEERRVQLKGLFEEGTYAGRDGTVGKCTNCHTEPASGYNPSYTAMRAAEFLYEKVANDSMPPTGGSWSDDDKAKLLEWINCGRPWE